MELIAVIIIVLIVFVVLFLIKLTSLPSCVCVTLSSLFRPVDVDARMSACVFYLSIAVVLSLQGF